MQAAPELNDGPPRLQLVGAQGCHRCGRDFRGHRVLQQVRACSAAARRVLQHGAQEQRGSARGIWHSQSGWRTGWAAAQWGMDNNQY